MNSEGLTGIFKGMAGKYEANTLENRPPHLLINAKIGIETLALCHTVILESVNYTIKPDTFRFLMDHYENASRDILKAKESMRLPEKDQERIKGLAEMVSILNAQHTSRIADNSFEELEKIEQRLCNYVANIQNEKENLELGLYIQKDPGKQKIINDRIICLKTKISQYNALGECIDEMISTGDMKPLFSMIMVDERFISSTNLEIKGPDGQEFNDIVRSYKGVLARNIFFSNSKR